MTNRLFFEHDGKVSHSPTSKLLVEDPRLAAFVDLHTETAWKIWPFMMDAFQRWPDSRNPREAGYSITMGRPGEISLYEDVQTDPTRRINFGRAMELFSTGEGYEVASLVEGYPWAKLGSGTVVDVSVARILRHRGVTNRHLGWWSKRVCQCSNLQSLPFTASDSSGHRDDRFYES